MALVGHISGSSQSQSTIGVTGSVVFSNSTTFPTLSGVGSDVVFFVSGTVGGKNVADQKTVAVFGGDTVVSGSLTVGTGSIKITSNDIQFGSNANRIELNGSDLKFFDATNPSGFTLTSLGSGGGGGGPSYFSSVTAGEIFTTGSVVSSGSYTVKNSAGTSVVVLGTNGGITGSEAVFSGDVAINGGDITTSAGTFNLANAATTLNLGTSSTTVNIGQASQAINVAGNLDVNGTADIAGNVTLSGNSQTVTHSGTGNLTLSSTSGNVVVEGSIFSGNDLTVPGNLTVNGSVVAIETTNLRVEDAVIIINSGSTTSNSKSAIAFASGSSTGVNALIFGALGSGDALAAAQMNVQDGTVAGTDLSYTTLVPIRASAFHAFDSNAKVTSADGVTLVVTASTVRVSSQGGSSEFLFADTLRGTVSNANGFTLGSAPGIELSLSGSNTFRMRHGAPGVDFMQHGTTYLNIDSGSHASSPNAATIVATAGQGMLVGGNAVTIISGSQIISNAGDNGFTVQRNGSSIFAASSTDGTTTNVLGGPSTATVNIFNGAATATANIAGAATSVSIGNTTTSTQTINIGNASTGSSTYNFAAAATGNGFTRTINVGTGGVAGSTTNINLGNANGGSVTVNNNFSVNGNTTIGNATGDTITFTGRANSSLLPSADTTYDLGSPQFRWANMYTGDLHLKNDRGDWTIIEEPDFLTITNNRNGKRYKFVMEEIG
jgi:hypothetical protein